MQNKTLKYIETEGELRLKNHIKSVHKKKKAKNLIQKDINILRMAKMLKIMLMRTTEIVVCYCWFWYLYTLSQTFKAIGVNTSFAIFSTLAQFEEIFK